MDILRVAGEAAGRCKTTSDGRYVWTVATAREQVPDMAAQTRDTLEVIEANLKEAGSDKTRILSATVFIADMAQKKAMDAEWCAWIPAGCWPQRACVEVGLNEPVLVEVVVIALHKNAG